MAGNSAKQWRDYALGQAGWQWTRFGHKAMWRSPGASECASGAVGM